MSLIMTFIRTMLLLSQLAIDELYTARTMHITRWKAMASILHGPCQSDNEQRLCRYICVDDFTALLGNTIETLNESLKMCRG